MKHDSKHLPEWVRPSKPQPRRMDGKHQLAWQAGADSEPRLKTIIGPLVDCNLGNGLELYVFDIHFSYADLIDPPFGYASDSSVREYAIVSRSQGGQGSDEVASL